MDDEQPQGGTDNLRVSRRKVGVAEVQAKYRQLLLMLLPVMGIFITGEILLREEWNAIRVGLFVFFVLFLAYRLFVLVRNK